MRVAGFEYAEFGRPWKRSLMQGQYVWASPIRNTESGLLSVNMGLEPTIGGHTAGEHHASGQLASILFKVLMVLGERGGGELVQTNLMGPCLAEGANKILAQYPEHPLLFENLCQGFRNDLLNGVEQIAHV